MKRSTKIESDSANCRHENTTVDEGYIVCQDCGLILDQSINVDSGLYSTDFYEEKQQDYERRIKIKDIRAQQDPKVKQRYEKIQVLNRWYKDLKSNFSEQKKTIEFLKSYGIGLNIDAVTYQSIKERYIKYNKNHRKTYQNMVIIFLAIIWLEIKETTNIRIERYIEVFNELGHKVNKKMLSNAISKVKRTEKRYSVKTTDIKKLEKEIKSRIKIVFQKDLNTIPYESVKTHFASKSDFEKLKIEMQLMANELLNKISYDQLKNLNYKALVAGLIYYIGQLLENRKIFTQRLIETSTTFSSTTIRKKYHFLRSILESEEQSSELLEH